MKLIKLKTSDNIELAGVLYESDSKKIVIHVHGFAENFYENRFLDSQAKIYNQNNYSLLAFNNRGSGYIKDLIKREGAKIDYMIGGSAYESFVDCYLDIDCAVNYAKSLGYREIVLQGHSYGCNKVIYYYHQTLDEAIKKIILLAPCDMVEMLRNEAEYIKECVRNLEANKVVLNEMFPPVILSPKTVVKDYLENSVSDFFRYRDVSYQSDVLNKIEIPVLIVIGEDDEYVFSKERSDIEKYFIRNLKKVSFLFIEGTGHDYNNKEEMVSKSCLNFIKAD